MNQFLLYFGCWGEPGHFLFDRHKRSIYDHLQISKSVIRAEELDGSRLFLPSPEVAGQGQLTHIVRNDAAVTVLAWWDRTFDQRPGCCAAIQSSGWDDADDLWMRFSLVYPELAAKLKRPQT